eukprot:281380-Prorocentrum_minimum.AAC.3
MLPSACTPFLINGLRVKFCEYLKLRKCGSWAKVSHLTLTVWYTGRHDHCGIKYHRAIPRKCDLDSRLPSRVAADTRNCKTTSHLFSRQIGEVFLLTLPQGRCTSGDIYALSVHPGWSWFQKRPSSPAFAFSVMPEDGSVSPTLEEVPLSPVPEEGPLPPVPEFGRWPSASIPDRSQAPLTREEVDKLPSAIGAFLDALQGWNPAGIGSSEPESAKQSEPVKLDQIFTQVQRSVQV